MDWRLALVLATALATAGCQTIGAGSVQRDRLGYADAIGTSRKEQTLLNIGFRHGADQDVEKDILFVKDELGINPDNDEPLLVFGSHQRNRDQIALLSRSMQEILTEFSVGVEVPERDLAEGRATPMAHPDPAVATRNYPLMHIRSSGERPADAFAAVPYRHRWFWIDDRDLDSKRGFMFLTVFSALAETGTAPQIPLITIPAR